MRTVAVVGGGAAGMMAAIAAAQEGAKVLLFEKNDKLGKKLFITGKGRCNVTNACATEEFFDNVITNPRFLYSAVYGFDHLATEAFFEENGCRLKVERGERVFPVSDHSSDIIRALKNALDRLKVQVELSTGVKGLICEDRDTQKAVTGLRLSNGNTVKADAVILATGGVSYASTGSDGDGHKWTGKLDLKQKECKPSLVPLEIKEDFCGRMQGLSLKNVSMTLFDGNRKLYEGFGEMMFTHFGITGPLVLTGSAYYAKSAYGKKIRAVLDLKPALSEEQLDKRILRDFEEAKNKDFRNSLSGLLPAKMIPVIVELSQIPGEKKVNEITKDERKHLVYVLKNLEMTVLGTRDFKEAIITMGGVDVKEVNPSTMAVKSVEGLYLAGELLDLDAVTGGFNLQIAWSTGHLAGICAAAGEK